MTIENLIQKNLRSTYEAARVVKMKLRDKFVVWSDIHLGDGSRRDDFRRNADLFLTVLRHYYAKQYKLILNGDIEELLKFKYPVIRERWSEVFDLFGKFASAGRLLKLEGNHDPAEWLREEKDYPFKLLPALRLKTDSGEIFLLHGHQSDTIYYFFPKLIVWLLRRFVFPLGIMNYTVAYDSRKQYLTEKRIYDFSRKNGLITLIGHTHRPLFESRTKLETIHAKIEELCRAYHRAKDPTGRNKIIATVKKYKTLLAFERRSSQGKLRLVDSVYGDSLPVPCLFNSGSVIGRSGITCLELKKGKIFLVYWADARRTKKTTEFNPYKPIRFLNEHYFKFILRREKIDYLFSRIRLLG